MRSKTIPAPYGPKQPGWFVTNQYVAFTAIFSITAVLLGLLSLSGVDDIVKFFVGMGLFFAYMVGRAHEKVAERTAKMIPFGPDPIGIAPMQSAQAKGPRRMHHVPPSTPAGPRPDVQMEAPEDVEVEQDVPEVIAFDQESVASEQDNGDDVAAHEVPRRQQAVPDTERFEF